jgi:hypothetical protein
MKKIITVFCLLLFISTNAQSYCYSPDHTITIIKSTVSDLKRSIDKLTFKETRKGLDKKQIYYKNNQVVMIRLIEQDTLQNIRYVKDWYFDCSRIIYAEQNIYVSNTEKSIDSEVMYFINEKLYQWLSKNQPVDTESFNFRNASLKLADYIWKMKVENGISET